MKSYVFDFKIPIILEKQFSMDEDEIIKQYGSIENCLMEFSKNGPAENIIEKIYQEEKDDFNYRIAANICLNGLTIKNHSKNEFDF